SAPSRPWLCPGPSRRVRECEQRSAGYEHDAQRCAQPPAPREVLLDRHHRGEREHPAEIADADEEHQQHQRPAAADAEETVTDAETERLVLAVIAVPVLHDECERGAALLQAASLERRELVETGRRHERRSYEPSMRGQPAALIEPDANEMITGMEDQADERPDQQVSGNEERRERARIRARAHERADA